MQEMGMENSTAEQGTLTVKHELYINGEVGQNTSRGWKIEKDMGDKRKGK